MQHSFLTVSLDGFITYREQGDYEEREALAAFGNIVMEELRDTTIDCFELDNDQIELRINKDL